MTLAALIRGDWNTESVRVATAIPATAATEDGKKTESVARVATVAVANPPNPETDPLPDPVAESRLQRVLAMLEHPEIRSAVLTDTEANPEAVILVIAIRGVATCELRIPRQKYHPFLLLDLIRRHGEPLH
jgi:hypothetical protein